MSAADNTKNGEGTPLRLLFDAGTLVVEGPAPTTIPTCRA